MKLSKFENEVKLSNTDLKEYDYYFNKLNNKSISVENLEIIKNNNIEMNKLNKEYNDIINNIEYGTLEIEGKKVNLTNKNINKYLCCKDRAIRKQVYSTFKDANVNNYKKIGNIFIKLTQLKKSNSELKQFKSNLENTIYNDEISIELFYNIINTTTKHKYLIDEYYKIKAEINGIEDFQIYDISAPIADYKFNLDIVAVKNIIDDVFEVLGNNYLNRAKSILQNNVNFEKDDKKHQSIVFSWHEYSFLNYRNNYIDGKNLLHELGHSVNYSLAKENQLFLYEDTTIFIGEIAALVNEILYQKYLIKNANTEEEKMFFLSKNIENYINLVFKQILITELEIYIYNSNASLEEINDKYLSLMKDYYCLELNKSDALDWINVGHLFRWSFYKYKYATGIIIANTIVNSLENGIMDQTDYIAFLKQGSSKNANDLLKSLNVDLTDENIINNAFNEIKNNIDELKQISNKLANKKR